MTHISNTPNQCERCFYRAVQLYFVQEMFVCQPCARQLDNEETEAYNRANCYPGEFS